MILNGYSAVYLPDHPRAYTNGMVYEHILQGEKKLGRPLLPNEVVHHIDHNRLNNDLNNLLIFNSQEDHGRFHKCGEDFSLLKLSINNTYLCTIEDTESIVQHGRICNICQKRIYGGKYCSNCLKLYHPYSKNKISRQELKTLIRNTPFTTIGKMCNVTDNAVRKWCDSYNLPRTKKQIKQYSDEEWDLL